MFCPTIHMRPHSTLQCYVTAPRGILILLKWHN